jgi:hypothetical protein
LQHLAEAEFVSLRAVELACLDERLAELIELSEREIRLNE